MTGSWWRRRVELGEVQFVDPSVIFEIYRRHFQQQSAELDCQMMGAADGQDGISGTAAAD